MSCTRLPVVGRAAQFFCFYNIAVSQQERISNTYLHDFLLLDEVFRLIIKYFWEVFVLFSEIE